MSRELPSFDLVVATVGRQAELERLLDSIAAQEYPRLRVVVVDQNDDERLAGTLAADRPFDVLRLRSPLGLSRARNVALQHVTGDVVAFPDDDCTYPPGTLEHIATRFAEDTALDGLTGLAEDESGRSSRSWKRDAVALTADNVWNRAISFTIFLRRDLVARVGAFDERLGLGSSEPWSSGEEIDYLIRAIGLGARIEYEPTLVVRHAVPVVDASVGLRDGASVGYLLRKHRYPTSVVVRMLVRPVGGVMTSFVQRDRRRAAYRAASVRGRLRGYLGARRSKISA